MTYRCLVVDDEELARDLIEGHLAQLDDFELVASCASAIEASKVLQKENIDLLFLDIEMPVLQGTDFFKNLIVKPKVIFTTAYRDYALDGFELNAVDYLLKPITFGRFFKAIEKFLSIQNAKQPTKVTTEISKDDFIFIREDRKQVKLWFDAILYVESIKDYIRIHTEEKTHMVKYGITAFEALLDGRFLRTHRSYIVNVEKITAYTNNDIEIGKAEIPIGDRYRPGVKRHFNQ